MAHDVALFITCLNDQFYPQVGVAVTKILEHFGCRVHFPDAQTCCGRPFFNDGFHPEARELAKRFIQIFEPYEYIVTPSASCCGMVREQFYELLKNDHAWEHGLERVASRTYEFVEFLDSVLKVDLSALSLSKPQTVTWHSTCHQRGIGLKDEGIKLLRQIDNVNFVPLEKSDQCCGFGGAFATNFPAISGAIVEDKVGCIAATKAEVTICNDAGCSIHISAACHRKGVDIKVKHLAELIAEAMGLGVDGW